MTPSINVAIEATGARGEKVYAYVPCDKCGARWKTHERMVRLIRGAADLVESPEGETA